jgi:hypothetical protein
MSAGDMTTRGNGAPYMDIQALRRALGDEATVSTGAPVVVVEERVGLLRPFHLQRLLEDGVEEIERRIALEVAGEEREALLGPARLAVRLEQALSDERQVGGVLRFDALPVFYGLVQFILTAFEIAERLRYVISDEPFAFNGHSTWITVSIGISLFPLHGRTTDELIGEADRAMYAAKLEGRNSVHLDIAEVD